jgi:EAL domain-containing protein (putative c-di-GMP-specific phosphodiesterase class I)/CHASE2 domain-containing sensor protein
MFGSFIRRRYGLIRLVAALVGLAALIGGSGQGLDQLLRSARDGIRSQSASGEIHIVEIDRRSLDAISVWPWPRRHHGELVDRLHRAGARSIAFDVDFSASSNPADDAAFAAALQRAGGGVILPTLRQRESAGSSNFIDNLPATALRDHGFLASVNVMPDADGMVRRMPLGLETAGVPRPSLASMIAERPAVAGMSFPIDYAIDPATIPHHSFIDIIEGRVGADQLRGKRILIGATAVEMGDRYPAPRFGVVPGVVIQALAAETLLAGPVPIEASGLWPLLLALILVFGVVRAGSGPARPLGFLAGTTLILALPLAAEHWLRITFPLAPAMAVLAVAAAGTFALDLAERFRQRALTDRTTGLPNLAALERAAATGGSNLVVVARIERFAAIAAGLGPAATANLIHRVADRLAFGHDQPIHRIDDDKLAWIDRGGDKSALEARLETLVALMRTPVDCGRLVDVTLDIGLAEAADSGPRQQVANASLAAVRAGRAGQSWNWFEDSSEETSWHLSLLGELDAAMASGDLWTAYQPKLDIATGRIVAVEALVRWQHPERGPIGPNQFIPLVEEHGRARDLTLYVFDHALRDAARWRAAGHDIAVAVNVSATLLLDQAFVGLLRDRLAAAPVPAERITIEVTESAAMKDPEQAIAALESWRALGLNISIDDYGTGQSSLGYLQKLPATELKIDMSFVRTLAADPRNAIMVRSTIAMAHELGMKVVAEGVEDGECLGLLTEMGCDTAQGWHVGKPMPAADFECFLSARVRDAA